MFGFSLAYSYLYPLDKVNAPQKYKEKLVFLWYFARFAVPLHLV